MIQSFANPLLRQQLCRHLDRLVAACKDARLGYETAAALSGDALVRSTLERLARKRTDMIEALETAIWSFGGKSRAGTTLAGAAHRRWFRIQSGLTAGSRDHICQACTRGEEHALGTYHNVLEQAPLAIDLVTLLSNHCAEIQAACDTLYRLRQTRAWQVSAA